MAARFEICSDRRVFLRHLKADAAIGILFGTVPILIPDAIAGDVDAKTIGATLIVAAIGFAIRASVVPWWWWQSGRVRYRVEDGRLVAESRGREVFDVACDEIYRVKVDGAITWRDMWYPPLALSEFPRVTLRTSESMVGPPIALWGDASRSFESDLRDAVSPYMEERRRRAGL